MIPCTEINKRYHTIKPSALAFRVMKKCSNNFPFRPDQRRFVQNGPSFYHFKEGSDWEIKDLARTWRQLGYNARVTMTRTRAIRGVKHGSWLSGSRTWHVWVSDGKY